MRAFISIFILLFLSISFFSFTNQASGKSHGSEKVDEEVFIADINNYNGDISHLDQYLKSLPLLSPKFVDKTIETPSAVPFLGIDVAESGDPFSRTDPFIPNIPSWFPTDDTHPEKKVTSDKNHQEMQKQFKDKDPTKENPADDNMANYKDRHDRHERKKAAEEAKNILKENVDKQHEEKVNQAFDKNNERICNPDETIIYNYGILFEKNDNDDYDKILAPSKSTKNKDTEMQNWISKAMINDGYSNVDDDSGREKQISTKKRKKSSDDGSTKLSVLPFELITEIYKYLDKDDIKTGMVTCKEFHCALNSLNYFWRPLLKRDFPEIMNSKIIDDDNVKRTIYDILKLREGFLINLSFGTATYSIDRNNLLDYKQIYKELLTAKKKGGFLWKKIKNDDFYNIAYILKSFNEVKKSNNNSPFPIKAKLYQHLNIFCEIGHFEAAKLLMENYNIRPTKFTFDKSVKSGNVELVKYLVEKFRLQPIIIIHPELPIFSPSFYDAAGSGNPEMLDYLVKKFNLPQTKVSELMVKNTIKSDYYEMLNYLDKNFGITPEIPPSFIMINMIESYLDIAAEYGNLETVKYLVNKIFKQKNLPTQQVPFLVHPDHLDDYDYSYTYTLEITKNTLRAALKSGNVKVLDFLLNKLGKTKATKIIKALIENKKNVTFSEIFLNKQEEKRRAETNKTILNLAVSSGKLKMVKYLFKELPKKLDESRYAIEIKPTLSTFIIAARTGNLDVVKYLIKKYPRHSAHQKTILAAAVESGNIELVKYLNEELNLIPTKTTSDTAVEFGHLEVVKYLEENFYLIPTNNANILDKVLKSNNLELAKYLVEKLNLDPIKFLSNFVIASDNLDALEYLIKTHGSKLTGKDFVAALQHALDTAIKIGNLELAKYLVEKFRLEPTKHTFTVQIQSIEMLEYMVKTFKNQATPIGFEVTQSYNPEMFKKYLEVVKSNNLVLDDNTITKFYQHLVKYNNLEMLKMMEIIDTNLRVLINFFWLNRYNTRFLNTLQPQIKKYLIDRGILAFAPIPPPPPPTYSSSYYNNPTT